jgi:YVTN family beta-propeller protein
MRGLGGFRAVLALAITVLLQVVPGAADADTPPFQRRSVAYVTNSESDSITAIDTASNSVSATITVGPAVGGAGSAIAISPEGNFVYIAQAERDVITVFDVLRRQVLTRIHIPHPRALIFGSQHEAYALTSGDCGDDVAVIDTSTNNVRRFLPLGGRSLGLAVRHDGSVVFAHAINDYDGGSLFAIDTSIPGIVGVSPAPGFAQSVTMAADDRHVYVVGTTEDPRTDVWAASSVDIVDTATRSVEHTISLSNATGNARFTPDSRFLYVGEGAEAIQAVDLIGGSVAASIHTGRTFVDGAFSPDGRRLYAVVDGAIAIVALPENTVIGTIVIPERPTMAVTSSDDSHVYVASRSENLTILDAASNTIESLRAVGGSPSSMQLSPDGALLYVVTDSGLAIVDTATQAVLQILADAEPQNLAATPDGKLLYVVENKRRTIDVIDILAQEVVASIPTLGAAHGRRFPTDVVVSDDGSLAYASYRDSAGFDGSIVVIRTANQSVIEEIPLLADDVGEPTTPSILALAQDGRTLYAVLNDTLIGAIDLASRRVRSTIPIRNDTYRYPAIRDMAMSPDGIWLYVAVRQYYSPSQVVLIDTASATIAGAIPLPSEDYYYPASMAVARDGRSIYVTQSKGWGGAFVSVLDVHSQQVVRMIPLGDEYGYDPSPHNGIALTADAATAYVTHALADSVEVVDTVAGQVIATLPAAGARHVVVADLPEGAPPPTLAATPVPAATPTSTPRLLPVWMIGCAESSIVVAQPEGLIGIDLKASVLDIALTPDGRTAYAITTGGSDRDAQLIVIDTATKQPIESIPFNDGLNDIVMSPDGALAYVTGYPSDGFSRLYAIDTRTSTVSVSAVFDASLSAVGFSRDGRLAYISLYKMVQGGSVEEVAILDTATNRVLRRFPAPAADIIGVSADGRFLLLVGSLEVVVWDLTTETRVSSIPLPGDGVPRGLIVPETGSLTYVALDIGCPKLEVIDTATMGLIGKVHGASPYAVADTLVGGLFYTATEDRIVAVDPASERAVARMPSCEWPDKIAVQCLPGRCPATPAAPARLPGAPPPTPKPTRTPTPTVGPTSRLSCSAGGGDGLACSDDNDCPDGACVVTRGVCDGSGWADGVTCECPNSYCPYTASWEPGACAAGPNAGGACDPSEPCFGSAACRGTSRICKQGSRKGQPCTRDEHCPDASCVSTGRDCVGGEHAFFACVDDAECVSQTAPHGVCRDGTDRSTVVIAGNVEVEPFDVVDIAVTLRTKRTDLTSVIATLVVDPRTPIFGCSPNLDLLGPRTAFSIDRTHVEAHVSEINPALADGMQLYTCWVAADTAEPGTYEIQVVNVSANDGRAVASGVSGTVAIVDSQPIPSATRTPTPRGTHPGTRTATPSATFTPSPTQPSPTPTYLPTFPPVATRTRIPTRPAPTVIPGFRSVAYVVNSGSDSISVLDTATKRVTSTIQVGEAARGARFTFSPDGRLAYFTAPSRNFVGVFDTASNHTVQTIPVEDPGTVAFTPDGRFAYVISQAACSNLIIIDVATRAVRRTVPIAGNATTIAFSSDGSVAYIGGDSFTEVDVATQTIIAASPAPETLQTILANRDDHLLYAQSEHGMSIIDVAARNVTRTVPVQEPRGPARLTPDGRYAYLGRGSDGLQMIDLDTESVADSWGIGAEYLDGVFNADGSRFYVLIEGAVLVITSPANRLIARIELLPKQPRSMVLADDGSLYVSTDGSDVLVVDTRSNMQRSLIQVEGKPSDLKLRADGKQLYVPTDNGLTIIDMATASTVQSVVDAEPSDAVVTPDGRTLYVIKRAHRTIDIVSTATNSVVATIPPVDEQDGRRFPIAIAVSTDSSLAFATFADRFGRNGLIAIIDREAQAIVETIELYADDFGMPVAPSVIAVTPDGMSLYVVLSGSQVADIDLASRRVKQIIPVGNVDEGPASSLKISPDGGLVHVALGVGYEYSPEWKAIDTHTNRVVDAAELGYDGHVDDMAVDRDGRLVYVRLNDFGNPYISVVDTQTHQRIDQIRLLGSEDNQPAGIALATDGHTLYATRFAGRRLLAVDTGTSAITDTIIVGDGPVRVVTADIPAVTTTAVETPAAPTLPVWLINEDRPSSVEVAQRGVKSAIDVGAPAADIAIAADGRTAYVLTNDSLRRGSKVVLIDTATRIVIGSVQLGELALRVLLTPDGTLAYVLSQAYERDAAQLSVIDTASMGLAASIDLHASPTGFALSPDGRFVYVVLSTAELVTVDTTRTVIVDTQPLPHAGIIAVKRDTNLLFVADDELSVIDLETFSVSAVLPLPPGVSEVVIPTNGSVAYLASAKAEGCSTAVSLDTSSLSLTGPLSIQPSSAIALSPDGTILYTATANEILVMNAANRDVLERIATDRPPKRLAVQCMPDTCPIVATPIPRTPPTLVPTQTPTPTRDVKRMCAGGSRDGLECDTLEDCIDGPCVPTMGVCDGGVRDGLTCDCVGGRCVAISDEPYSDAGICRGGLTPGKPCSTNGACDGGNGCIGTQKVCLDGPRLGVACLSGAQCNGGICAGSGSVCIGGPRDGLACVDDWQCITPTANGVCQNALERSTSLVATVVTGRFEDQVSFDVVLLTNRGDLNSLISSLTFDVDTPIVACYPNWSLAGATMSFALSESRLDVQISNLDPPTNSVLYSCTVSINARRSGVYPLQFDNVLANQGRVFISTQSGAIMVDEVPFEPMATTTPTASASLAPTPTATPRIAGSPTATATPTPNLPSPSPSYPPPATPVLQVVQGSQGCSFAAGQPRSKLTPWLFPSALLLLGRRRLRTRARQPRSGG